MIEKIKQGDDLSQSKDLVNDNIEKLKSLFPEIVTEGKIDFKALQEVLGEELEEGEEYYRFTWAGKSQARREAHKPSTGTLRPAKDESVDWDTTQNLYLEGDNLEVLKLLQKSYASKVKMIYIDPPYNTGKDFVYKDNYKDNLRNYQELTGQIDSDGNKISTNSDSDGRYHSNWLNMMYPRLKLARNLLKDDGVIFMSIDDNEVENLKKIGNEIFGESNFLCQMVWKRRTSSALADKKISKDHEYVIAYQKKFLPSFIGYAKDYKNYKNPNNDPKGDWMLDNLTVGMNASMRPNQAYDLVDPETGNVFKFNPNRVWAYIPESMNKLIEEKRIYFPKDISKKPMLKRFKSNLKDTHNPFSTILAKVGLNKEATKTIQKLFQRSLFEYSKPLSLLKELLNQIAYKDDIILDFFAGSASTAHAVMEINSEDGGHRKYIQVQLPEPTAPNSEAYKAGYKNITEIGKERIRQVIKKVESEKSGLESNLKATQKSFEELKKEEANNPALFEKGKRKKFEKLEKEILTLQEKIQNIENSDLGFKVFKLDSSNIQSWSGNPDNLEQELFDAVDNIKTDRSEEDVLYEILLKYGLDLTLPIEEKEMVGKTVFNVGMGALFICLAKELTKEVAIGIGEWKTELNPAMCRVIFKDSGFKSDADKTNAAQNLKRYGITEIKSI
jgi:adenine-specific DNA-methyltransferase